jgi:hypothetical protein
MRTGVQSVGGEEQSQMPLIDQDLLKFNDELWVLIQTEMKVSWTLHQVLKEMEVLAKKEKRGFGDDYLIQQLRYTLSTNFAFLGVYQSV